MKVVIYTHYLKNGGAEKRASIFANYLFKNKVDVEVVLMHQVEQEYPLNQNICKHYIANSKQEYKALSKKERLNKLTSILEEIKPTIIISFLSTYGLYAVLAKRKSKQLKNTKLIYAVSLYQRKYDLRHRIIDFLACLHSSYIFLQCNEQYKCNKLFKKKCYVIYNPIEDKWNEVSLERTYEDLAIISIGRLDKQKNYPLTIKVVKEFHKQNPKVSLDIYGEGKLKEKLNKLISRLNASEYIKIHPFSFEIEKEYLKHNIYISSSRYEGFPNSLVEAMMSSLVSLSFPCPTGPKEIIESNVNGLLFKTKKELISILNQLSQNKNMCISLAKEARLSTLNNFETNKSLSNLVKILNEIDN